MFIYMSFISLYTQLWVEFKFINLKIKAFNQNNVQSLVL